MEEDSHLDLSLSIIVYNLRPKDQFPSVILHDKNISLVFCFKPLPQCARVTSNYNHLIYKMRSNIDSTTQYSK